MAVGADGSIYLPHYDPPPGYFEAIAPDGTVRWSVPFEGPKDASADGGPPAISADGTIYVGGPSNRRMHPGSNPYTSLYAFSPNGMLKWTFPFDTISDIRPFLGPDGTVYVFAEHSLFALAPDGRRKWEFSECYQKYPTAAVAASGNIYTNCGGTTLIAVTPAGKLKKGFRPALRGEAISLAVAQKAIYAATETTLYAFAPSGKKKWSRKLGDFQGSRGTDVAFANDGAIYAVTGTNKAEKIFAFSPAGDRLWNYDAKGSVSRITVAPDGTLYASSYEGKNFFALSASGQLKWSHNLGYYANAYTAIGPDGTVYAEDAGGILAFGVQ